MKVFVKYMLLVFLMCYSIPNTQAQIDEGYILSDAAISEARENMNFKNYSKKSLIIFPESESQLYVIMSISDDTSQTNFLDQSEDAHPERLMKLTLPVDRRQIQEALTSTKKFYTIGHLLMNNISKEVKVEYVPLPSGTEEEGNFNISIILQFNPCDFNLCAPDVPKQLIIEIKNAVVNRV